MALQKTNEQFLEELKNRNPNVEPLELYQGDKTKIKFRCLLCGNEFINNPNHVLRGQVCKACGRKKQNMIHLEQGKIKFYQSYCSDTIELLEEYNGMDKPILVQCKICGNQYKVSARNLAAGSQCMLCFGNPTKTHEQFAQELKEINPHLEILSTYINTKTPIQIKCIKCGYKGEVTPNAVLQSPGYCPNCNRSKGELKIAQWLSDKNIKFISQYTFSDCIDKLPLPFDFYLEDYNICIEFDGRQHYDINTGFGMDKVQQEQNYQKIQYHDNIKTDYCKNKNIKLIRIPYWDYQNIDSILQKEVIK